VCRFIAQLLHGELLEAGALRLGVTQQQQQQQQSHVPLLNLLYLAVPPDQDLRPNWAW
jgi:hypothetical protein